jgi:site-specific DNA-methyltransferase (adenine-specific)
MKKFRIGNHVLWSSDCLDVLKKMRKESVDLIITDPPYNIGLNYGGVYKDSMPKPKFFEYMKERLKECVRVLKPTGTLYLISYPEINSYLMPFLDENLIFRRWLTWHYPSNIGHWKNNYTRSQRSILFYVKSKNYVFNKQEIIQHYKNPEVKKVKERIEKGSKGRGSYYLLRFLDLIEIQKGMIDVYDFNMLKNISKDRVSEHPCQLPLELVKLLIKVSSNKGNKVLDPFAGTFMVSLAAKQLKRKSVGIEINPEYIKFGIERLKK